MQIIPAFAYLMPIVILFSVGSGAAVITTMIYAIPPAIRITALGIRGVPGNTVEAAQAMGSTKRQMLQKVQLPLARRMLLLGVNQTILFALSMVVIAGLIGGKGLGDVVTSGLNSYPALAILAGIVIVVMAMALDRITEAVADRTDPTRRHLTPSCTDAGFVAPRSRGGDPWRTSSLARNACGDSRSTTRAATARDWMLARIQSVLDYIAESGHGRVQHHGAGSATRSSSTGSGRCTDFLVETPWFIALAGFTAIALVVSGWRPAVTTFLMLGLIGVMGEWEPAMDTASQVLVATVLAVVDRARARHLAGESPRFSSALRPVNDVLQTLPQLVYLIPLIYLMPVSTVPGVIAGVLYAFPIVVRLVENGLRDVEPNAVEAATAFGATRRQVMLKVRIPLAQDSIMLGVNQGIIMVLAVVVIGGLVGSPGLGYEVAQGLGRSDFGLGVIASVAILALGIALDRVTRSVRTRSAGTVGVMSQRKT